MASDKAIQLLSEKLTDNAQIQVLYDDELTGSERQITYTALSTFKRSDEVKWYRREAMRIACKVYKTSTILDEINAKFPFFAHISREDKTLVAFTPDKAAGEADRQVRSSIGRLLARAYPCISENQLRDLVETHQAEANPNVEFLSGLDIARAYLDPNSPSSCMRAEASSSSKNWTIDNVPALAYATEGVRLAVLRRQDGGIAARCLVVEINGEKRMIRNYGSPSLRKYLIDEGYAPGGWKGVVFNTVKVPGKENRYVFPYLDCMGGVTQHEHCSVSLVDGKLTVVADRTLQKAIRMSGCSQVLSGAYGYVEIAKPFNAEALKTTCQITGEKYKSWEEKDEVDVFHNGEIVKTVERLIPERESYIRTFTFVLAKAADTILVDGQFYINYAPTLGAYGVKKLSTKYYEGEFYSRDRDLVALADGSYIRTTDAVIVVTGDVTREFRHVSEVKPKELVRLANKAHMKVFAVKGVKFETLASKAKVHKSVHDIVQLWTGEWAYDRGIKEIYVAGTIVRSKGSLVGSDREAAIRKAILTRLDETFGGQLTIDKLLSLPDELNFDNSIYVQYVPGKLRTKLAQTVGWCYLRRNYLTGDATLEDVIGLTKHVIARSSSFEEVKDETGKYIDRLFAEMTAVEAPHYLERVVPVMPEPTIEILQA